MISLCTPINEQELNDSYLLSEFMENLRKNFSKSAKFKLTMKRSLTLRCEFSCSHLHYIIHCRSASSIRFDIWYVCDAFRTTFHLFSIWYCNLCSGIIYLLAYINLEFNIFPSSTA